MRTSEVARRTVLLLVRYRFHLDIPSAQGVRQLVAEDADVLAFRGGDAPDFLDDDEALALLGAHATQNLAADAALQQAERALAALADDGAVRARLDVRAEDRAKELLDSHRRVRRGARAARAGLRVRAQTPVDVLGVYIYLPVVKER